MGWRPYNLLMLNSFTSLLGTAVMERVTLLLNHVLTSEAVATARLQVHTGRCIQLQLTGWPPLPPAPPQLAFVVTPAGLLEWCGADGLSVTPDLRLSLDASNPLKLALQWAAGERPKVGIEGDAGLATDVSWLIDNLHWDIEDDLARIVGQTPAHELARLGTMLAGGLREAAKAINGLLTRNGSDASQ